MSLLSVFCSNLIGVGIRLFFLLWASGLLLGKRPEKRGIASMVIVAAAFLAVISALGAAFYQYGILHWRYNTGHILFYYLILPIQMLLLRVVYKERYIACPCGGIGRR